MLFLLGMMACQIPQQQEDAAPTVELVKRPKVERCPEKLVFDYDLLVTEIENYFLYFDSENLLH